MATTKAAGSERVRQVPEGCPRCSGLMVPDWIIEGNGLEEEWRCVICGERLDPVILKNRLEQSGRFDRERQHSRKLAMVA